MTADLLDAPVITDATRRQFLTGAAAAGVLTACGSALTATERGTGWSFTDDRGIMVDLPARPMRIAAYEIAGAPLRFLGAPVIAVFGGTAMEDSGHFDGLDLRGIESAGAVYGEVNFEKLAALDVDLIVTLFNADQPAVFGFNDSAAQALAERIAPIVAFDGTADIEPTTRRFWELAGLLGADLRAPRLTAARQRYTDARASLRAATAGKPGLRAVAVFPNPADGTIGFIGPSEFYPQLRQFVELGLDLAEFPDGYEQVSLEEADRHLGDLMLIDSFTDLDAVTEAPTWAALPAVAAGQTVVYEALAQYRYDQQADELEAVAAAVRAADPEPV